MEPYRIALANIRFPSSAQDAVQLAEAAVRDAAAKGAKIVCFAECHVPGYRAPGDKRVAPPDAAFLDEAWRSIAAVAAESRIAVVLGTERIVDGGLRASTLVIGSDGQYKGFQDKVQLHPSEDETYSPGTERLIFEDGALTFGVVICVEGWRYPETVRWAARRGAHVVFHSQFNEAEPGSYRPTNFADPANTFHEKALLCRAAENTCYIASVNFASEGSGTTSAVVRPDGTVQCWQPYGEEELLIADIDLAEATGLLASRLR